jgi:hypothetical protein
MRRRKLLSVLACRSLPLPTALHPLIGRISLLQAIGCAFPQSAREGVCGRRDAFAA